MLCRNLLNIHLNTTHYYDGKSLHLYSARKCSCIFLRTFHSYRLLTKRETYQSINAKGYFFYETYLLYMNFVNSRINYPTILDHKTVPGNHFCIHLNMIIWHKLWQSFCSRQCPQSSLQTICSISTSFWTEETSEYIKQFFENIWISELAFIFNYLMVSTSSFVLFGFRIATWCCSWEKIEKSSEMNLISNLLKKGHPILV